MRIKVRREPTHTYSRFGYENYRTDVTRDLSPGMGTTASRKLLLSLRPAD